MKLLATILSYVALFVMVICALLFLVKQVSLEQMKAMMLAATIVWFVSTPIWMWKENN